jgi:hypothetical protein
MNSATKPPIREDRRRALARPAFVRRFTHPRYPSDEHAPRIGSHPLDGGLDDSVTHGARRLRLHPSTGRTGTGGPEPVNLAPRLHLLIEA